MTEPTTDIETVMERANQAAAVFTELDQAQTDRIVRAAFEAGFNNRVRLAKLAAEETGLGKWQDKVIKNVVAAQFVHDDIKNLKTVGVISDDPVTGIVEIAQPMGPILAIIPVTNPTSTAIFKILICLKTRNPIIISPSRKARHCVAETARLCYQAALAADAPEDCIQWLPEVSREQTQALMTHRGLALILATGGTGLVTSAYSSGTPTLGVGAGNVPVFIEASADVAFAVEQIMLSKLFDNGTICASEQAIVIERAIAPIAEAEFSKRGAVFLDAAAVKKLEAVAIETGTGLMNPAVVGQSATTIARMAGIDVPADAQLLMAPLQGVGRQYPLSGEVLAPILAYYVVEDFDRAVNVCIDLNFHGGIGHTASLFSNDEEKIRQFSMLLNAGRILVNQPSSQGAVGGIFNRLNPSLTLGCGTGGKNITTDNVSARHLLNIQRIARRRVNARLARFDQAKYLDESLDAQTIERQFNRNG
ncbi:MAG: aldehyde dehydrogenase family protein [Methylococcaceae bacterium]|nr:aldehyde dehydrogenase family protein [Methylococcaceae bacterium]